MKVWWELFWWKLCEKGGRKYFLVETRFGGNYFGGNYYGGNYVKKVEGNTFWWKLVLVETILVESIFWWKVANME
jgi:hypothetical protein